MFKRKLMILFIALALCLGVFGFHSDYVAHLWDNLTYDGIKARAEWTVFKFNDPDNFLSKQFQEGTLTEEQAIELYPEKFIAKISWDYNLGLNEGLQELIDLICGIGTPTAWDNSNAYLGVGSDNTAASATQTGLISVLAYKAMESGYPQKSAQTAEWRAVFGSGDANDAWEEYSVSNTNSDSGKNLNRKVESKGTKVSGESWTLSLKITFS